MARKAHGANFVWDTGDGGAAIDFGYITNMSFSGMSKPTADVSHFGTVMSEFISTGVADAGEVTFDLIFDSNDQAWNGSTGDAIMVDFMAGTMREVTITYDDLGGTQSTQTFVCNGIITAMGLGSGGMADALTASMTIKFTGEPSITDTPLS